MSAKTKIALLALIFFVVGAAGILFLFFSDIAVMNPKGAIAGRERDLLMLSTYLMLIVVVPVILLTFAIAWKYHIDNHKAKYDPDWDYSLLAESIWWGIPFILVAVLSVITYKACHELDPFKPLASEKKPLTIQVVSLQWKWLFLYPEQGIASVNHFAIPEQTPIRFEVTSDAPMNSFWIPQLSGQVYAMAGMKAELHAIANEPGSFRGSSANISGEGFSGMWFTAEATTERDFYSWVSSVKGSRRALTLREYDELVKPSSYVSPSYYSNMHEGLFDWIMMQYMEH